jgi:nicotinamidase-related amidase
MLVSAADSLLLIVDIQKRLAPSIRNIDGVVEHASALLRAAVRLEIPILFTEQMPGSLGPTIEEVRRLAPDAACIAKAHFNAAAEPSVLAAVNRVDRRQIVVCGTEAHVCVLQTAFGLKSLGFNPIVVCDAIGSRKPADFEAALRRFDFAGIATVSTEMVLFEWLQRADTEEFRDVLPLIKALDFNRST